MSQTWSHLPPWEHTCPPVLRTFRLPLLVRVRSQEVAPWLTQQLNMVWLVRIPCIDMTNTCSDTIVFEFRLPGKQVVRFVVFVGPSR